MGINLEVPGVILGCRGQFWGAGAHFRVPGQEEDFGGGGGPGCRFELPGAMSVPREVGWGGILGCGSPHPAP